MELVVYEAACRAVSQAKTIDEVKEITNRAEAARAYAKQAKNRQMELDALEIRVRAERRLGEIILVLKDDGTIRVGGPGRGHLHERPPVTLKELGIDGDSSSIAQRLAKLPESRFASEIVSWRKTADQVQRVEVPLQRYRIPSIRGDRQRAALKAGRRKIEATDPFDKYKAPDGRRIADWRAGELERLEAVFSRAAECARRLRLEMPVANADPLSTVEMIFDRMALASVLSEVFASERLPQSDAGLDGDRIRSSRAARSRTCEHCQREFVMDSRGNTAGRFCSRDCSQAHQRAKQ